VQAGLAHEQISILSAYGFPEYMMQWKDTEKENKTDWYIQFCRNVL
jgi:hypothetical protein